MRRTQIQLDDPTYHLLRSEAFKRGVSMSALVRRLLQERLGPAPKPRHRLEEFTFINSGRSEPSDLDPISERHDEALAEDFAR